MADKPALGATVLVNHPALGGPAVAKVICTAKAIEAGVLDPIDKLSGPMNIHACMFPSQRPTMTTTGKATSPHLFGMTVYDVPYDTRLSLGTWCFLDDKDL